MSFGQVLLFFSAGSMWISLRIKLNSCFKTIKVKTKARCSTADTNVHHMNALPCAQAAGRVPPGLEITGWRYCACFSLITEWRCPDALLSSEPFSRFGFDRPEMHFRVWFWTSLYRGRISVPDAEESLSLHRYATHSWTRSSLTRATNKTNSLASREFTGRNGPLDVIFMTERSSATGRSSSPCRVFNAPLPLWCVVRVKLKLLRWEATASPLPVTWDGHQQNRLHACKCRHLSLPVKEHCT